MQSWITRAIISFLPELGRASGVGHESSVPGEELEVRPASGAFRDGVALNGRLVLISSGLMCSLQVRVSPLGLNR